jgi:hypothetical protein
MNATGHTVKVPRLLAVAAVILLAAPASAGAAPVCKVPGPEARAERRLQDVIRERAGYGFRADRDYVAQLMAQGRQPGHISDLPVTEAEQRYLNRRPMLHLGPRASAYLRRHPEFSAWWDIRDDWPRGPYVAVFVAGDPAN